MQSTARATGPALVTRAQIIGMSGSATGCSVLGTALILPFITASTSLPARQGKVCKQPSSPWLAAGRGRCILHPDFQPYFVVMGREKGAAKNPTPSCDFFFQECCLVSKKLEFLSPQEGVKTIDTVQLNSNHRLSKRA